MALDVSKPAEPPKPVHIGGESLADRLLPHVKKILVGAIMLAVVLSVYFGYRAYKRGKQTDETAKLTAANALAIRDIAPPPPKSPDDPTPAVTPPDDPENPTYPDLATRGASVLAELAKQGVDSGHAYRAGFLLDAGKLDEAIAEYKAGEGAAGLEGVLCREGVGIAYEAKALAAQQAKDSAGQQAALEAALAAYASMQPEVEGPRHAFSLYHQGRVLETLGKKAEAKSMLEKAREKAPINPDNTTYRKMLEEALEKGQIELDRFEAEMQRTTGLPELVERRLQALGAA